MGRNEGRRLKRSDIIINIFKAKVDDLIAFFLISTTLRSTCFFIDRRWFVSFFSNLKNYRFIKTIHYVRECIFIFFVYAFLFRLLDSIKMDSRITILGSKFDFEMKSSSKCLFWFWFNRSKQTVIVLTVFGWKEWTLLSSKDF